MSDTLKSLRQELGLWLRGDLQADTDVPLLNAAINDALEDIWMSMMQVQLARFFGLDSPVSFTLPVGAERVQLVAIADPLIAPVVGSVAGGGLGARTYLVTYTYVTESGSETLPSSANGDGTVIALGAGTLAQVTAPVNPGGALGWNCYASVSDNAALLALQNQQPLPFGVPFTETPVGWRDYPGAQAQPGAIQSASTVTPANAPPPSENTTADNLSWIVHLEVRTSDTLLRTWNQTDIDSELMKRYGRELSSASEYQTYVWDLINGNRLEFRPSAGMTFTPRYFYIAKPRRLRYDPSPIPYVNVAGVHEFIVNRALGRLKLSIDEYLGSEGWNAEAEKVRNNIRLSLVQELFSKNLRIAPHLF